MIIFVSSVKIEILMQHIILLNLILNSSSQNGLSQHKFCKILQYTLLRGAFLVTEF